MEANVGQSGTLNGDIRTAKHAVTRAIAAAGLSFASLMAVITPAHAVDGCLVLLCFAAPSWRAIPQCVPPISQVLRDLARGRSFPTCAMSGPRNTAAHQWASAPTYCPPQYTRMFDTETSVSYACDYLGAVSVSIEGALWARTWSNIGGDTVTEYAPAAKATLGIWDTRFDDDYATWLGSLPPSSPPCPTC